MLQPDALRPFKRCPYPNDCNYSATTNKTCIYGTTGLLCSQCIVGYNRIGYTCTACLEAEVGIRITVISIIFLTVVVLLWYFRVQIRNLHRKYSSAWKDIAIAIKIMVSFQQINSSLPSMIDSFQWPDSYVAFLNRFAFVDLNVLSLLGLQCSLDVDYRSTVVIVFFVPVIVSLVTLFGYYAKIKKIAHTQSKDQSELEKTLERKKLMSQLANVGQAEKITRQTTTDQLEKDVFTNNLEKTMAKMFDLSDFDQSGFIDASELQHIIQYCSHDGVTLSTPMINEIMLRAGATKIKHMDNQKVCETLALGRREFLASCTRTNDNEEGESEDTVEKDLALSKYISFTRAVHWVATQQLKSTYVSTAVQILLLFHAPVSAKAFLYFDCDPVGTNSTFVRQDYKLRCRSDEWWAFVPVAISLLVCFAFALPLWLSGYLFARRNSLKSPATRQTIGWLYSRYHEGSEWWEVFEVFRKMILTGMLVYLPAPTRAPVALLICIIATAVLNYKRPHLNTHLFWVAEGTFLCITMKYLVTVFGMASSSSSNVPGDSSGAAEIKNDRELLGGFLIALDMSIFLIGIMCVVLIVVVLKKDVIDINEKAQQNELTLNTTNGTNTRIYPMPVKRNDTLKRLTMATIKRAVTNDQAHKIVEESQDARANKMKQLNASRLHASSRVQQRLAKRMKLKQVGTLARRSKSFRKKKKKNVDPEHSGLVGNDSSGEPTAAAAAAAAAAAQATKTSDWEKMADPTSGHPYWYNAATKVSSWTDPNQVEKGAN